MRTRMLMAALLMVPVAAADVLSAELVLLAKRARRGLTIRQTA